jgi:hypothetical protein
VFSSATTSEGTLFSTLRTLSDNTPWSRRALLLGSLLAGAPFGLSAGTARAGTIDRSENGHHAPRPYRLEFVAERFPA